MPKTLKFTKSRSCGSKYEKNDHKNVENLEPPHFGDLQIDLFRPDVGGKSGVFRSKIANPEKGVRSGVWRDLRIALCRPLRGQRPCA